MIDINKYEVHSYLLPCPDVKHSDGMFGDIVIGRSKQRDGTYLWKITHADVVDGPVLNHRYEWEYNSLPSARRNSELKRTRYATLLDALDLIRRYLRKLSKEAA